jgi:hypothetical protein
MGVGKQQWRQWQMGMRLLRSKLQGCANGYDTPDNQSAQSFSP